jgi:hypothetical protein
MALRCQELSWSSQVELLASAAKSKPVKMFFMLPSLHPHTGSIEGFLGLLQKEVLGDGRVCLTTG